MEVLDQLWNEVKEQLSDTLPTGASMLLSRVELKNIEEGVALITAQSKFVLDSIKDYKTVIENVLSVKMGENITVSIEVSSDTKISEVKSQSSKENTGVSPKKETSAKNPTLNPRYTLDNFIEGDNSDIAFRAAQVIAMNPGNNPFNPCLIYGGVGLGKTHLLQAIGNYIYSNHPDMNIIYVTAESFTNEFIASFGNKESNNKFKKTYRNADVLLIDDIHFLQKKESTQEELFHTFVELYHNNKQIVFTCDRPITELTDITDRLRTRFSSGLNVDLRPPKYEVRVAIAKQKNKEENLDIPDNVLDYICQAVRTNVRDLEGALITISGIARLVGTKATIEMAKEQLKNMVVEQVTINANYSINDVFTATANYFNVSLVDMKGASRSKNI
ncbi:MAG: chromosomal replication initiator protein DnaA, partial [Candidatus Ornithospirochaeta sp.]